MSTAPTATDQCPGCASNYSLHRAGCPAEPGNVTLDSRLALLHQLGNGPSLTLPADLSFDAWRELGATLVHTEQRVMWWLGDWWLYGDDKWGEDAAAAIPFGYSAETLRKAAYVAERIPVGRRTDLPFGTHDAVASCQPADQDRILARAAAEGLNRHHVRELAKRARATNGNGHSPPPPEPAPPPECVHDFRCLHCGLPVPVPASNARG